MAFLIAALSANGGGSLDLPRASGSARGNNLAPGRRITVVRGAPGQRDGPPGPDDTVWRPARWTAPDGQPRSGWIPVSPQAAVGSSARVWVNHSGSLTGQPLQRAQLQRRIVIAGVLTAVMLGLVLCLVGGAGRFLFNRRRLADWDKAWRVVGPRSYQ